MKLTQTSVARFKMPAGKTEHIEFDEDMHGFGLRVRAGGKAEHRSFIAQYKVGDKHRRITLGNASKVTLENARREARKIFGKVALGTDPANEKVEARKVASETFDAAIKKYLEARVRDMKPASYAQAKTHLETHWKPLHSLALGSIARANVAPIASTIAKERGPIAANRARATLSECPYRC
jgi:hypothetical protein